MLIIVITCGIFGSISKWCFSAFYSISCKSFSRYDKNTTPIVTRSSISSNTMSSKCTWEKIFLSIFHFLKTPCIRFYYSCYFMHSTFMWTYSCFQFLHFFNYYFIEVIMVYNIVKFQVYVVIQCTWWNFRCTTYRCILYRLHRAHQ